MIAFTYERAQSPAQAAAAVAARPGARFIAGGTNLLDLMKLQIETPCIWSMSTAPAWIPWSPPRRAGCA